MEKKTLIINSLKDLRDNLNLLESLESNNIDIKGELIDKIQNEVRKEISQYFIIEKIYFYTNYREGGQSLGIEGNFNNEGLKIFSMNEIIENPFNYYFEIQIPFEEMKNKKIKFRFVSITNKNKEKKFYENEYREIDFNKIIEGINLKYIENGKCENISIKESNINYIYNFSTRSLIIVVKNPNIIFDDNHISMIYNDF